MSMKRKISDGEDALLPVVKKKIDADDISYLPNASERYAQSFAQDSNITCVEHCKTYVVTGTASGAVTFWKKLGNTIKVAKQFVAHPKKQISSIVFTDDGKRMVTAAVGDDVLKLYDISTLDMTQIIKLREDTAGCCWCKSGNSNDDSYRLIVTEGNRTRIVNPDDEHEEEEEEEEEEQAIGIHRSPVSCLAYNWKYGFVISVDTRGIIEYWLPGERAAFPSGKVQFKMKSETDLFDLAKNKVTSSELKFSSDFEKFSTASSDGVRIWDVKTGKKLAVVGGSFEFSNQFILNGTGAVNVTSIKSGNLVSSYGEKDCKQFGYKFNNFILLNNVDFERFNIEMISSDNTLIKSKLTKQPLIVCTAENSNRLFLFSNEPIPDSLKERDESLANRTKSQVKSLPKDMATGSSTVTLHTTLGDIKIKLFNSHVPNTVENFILLNERNYYDHLIFHRVIKKFMLQTGDPNGDGTGGESAHGGYLKDEFSPTLRHDKPFMVSMANSGVNTNGSQFFITTEPAPWLDGKHSVFGEVIEGKDVVRAIECVETDKNDKPIDQVVILSTTQE